MDDFLIPNPTSSDTEYARFHHLDLPKLQDMEIADELYYLRAHLFVLPLNPWYRQRLKMLEGELTSRKYRKRQ